MPRYRVCVDIDGVLWDILTPLLDKYSKMMGEKITPEDIKSYDLSMYVKNPEWLDCTLKSPFFWSYVDLYDGVYEAIERLTKHPQIEVLIVTATDYEVAEIKIQRLLSLLPMLSRDQIIITRRKDVIVTDFMIDDYEENLRNYEGNIHICPILISRPYNESIVDGDGGIRKVQSLEQALRGIETIIQYSNASQRNYYKGGI